MLTKAQIANTDSKNLLICNKIIVLAELPKRLVNVFIKTFYYFEVQSYRFLIH